MPPALQPVMRAYLRTAEDDMGIGRRRRGETGLRAEHDTAYRGLQEGCADAGAKAWDADVR